VTAATLPRAYLERCFAVIADREPVVKAWVVLNPSGAREAADASTERYRRGLPIWPIDGMPIGVKDLIETKACRPGMAAPRLPGIVRDGTRRSCEHCVTREQ
jgi:Asp-tRNA(Asn)/Glu-tRNA(Gln) amidotransferase A subunit family amidase